MPPLRLNYAQKHLSIPTTNFIARIGLTNAGSIALFHKLGFGKEKVVEVFQEVTMRMGWVEGVEDGKMGEGERVEGLRKERWVDVGEEVEID
jgi:L-amino acid N-acyltransferase YncA